MAEQTIEINAPAADPQKRYVSSWVKSAVATLLYGVPKYIDDIDRDFSAAYEGGVYERMMNDSAAGGAIDTLRTGALDPGLSIVPCIEAPKAWKADAKLQAEHKKASEVCDFVKECLEPLEFSDAPLEDVLFEMMLAMPYGSSVAEKVYETKGSRYVLTDLSVKPRENLQYVLDEANKLVGLNVKKPGETSLIALSSVVDPNILIDRAKFAVLTFNPKCRDPRGASAFRRAYTIWYIKTQVWPAFFKFLLQFGTPSIIGFTPDVENASGQYKDSNGDTQTGDPETIMMMALQDFFQNGSVTTFKGGSKVELLQSSGEGQAFRDGIDIFNREITQAVLLQTRATMEAQHGSKADSQTSQDILDVLTRRIRNWVCAMVRRDIFAHIVEINLGPSMKKYTPLAVLSKPSDPDFAAMAGAVASLKQAGWFDGAEDMLPEADEKLGFTPRDMNAYRAYMESERDAQNMQSKEMGRLFDPTGQDAPKE